MPDDPPVCARDGCPGVVFDGDACLAHLPRTGLPTALERLASGATVDVRNTTFTAKLFDALRRALTPAGRSEPMFRNANFDGAVLPDSATFEGALFLGRATFGGARLHDVNFGNVEFRDAVRFHGTTFTGTARFDGATFGSDADFTEATFAGDCHFSGAQFQGPAHFITTFEGTAQFGPPAEGDAPVKATRFGHPANFRHARFNGPARFGAVRVLGALARAQRRPDEHGRLAHRGGTEFVGGVSFEDTEFARHAGFWGCVFGSPASFEAAKFRAGALFDDCAFRSVSFADATFTGRSTFMRSDFKHAVTVDRATFEDADFGWAVVPAETRFGPCRAASLDLSNLRAAGKLVVRCSVSRRFTATGLQAADGVNLELDGAVRVEAPDIRSAMALTVDLRDGRLNLADASFASPATIAGPAGRRRRRIPRLLRMSTVDAENLTLVGLDLRGTRFFNCYNRDKLRIEGPPLFAGTPVGSFPRRRLWTARRAIAEEHLWRARYDRRPDGWFPAGCRDVDEDVPPSTPMLRNGNNARGEAARIQAVYRDLRKSREDAKDEPGAADLYYGEMEMRRVAASPPSVERALLTLYWAVAGYGLRASRAFATLVLVLALGTLGFATIGFKGSAQIEYRPVAGSAPGVYRQVTVSGARPGWDEAAFHAVESATSLLRPTPSRSFTSAGKAIEIGLRLLGPLLLGLAILSIRGRVKR